MLRIFRDRKFPQFLISLSMTFPRTLQTEPAQARLLIWQQECFSTSKSRPIMTVLCSVLPNLGNDRPLQIYSSQFDLYNPNFLRTFQPSYCFWIRAADY